MKMTSHLNESQSIEEDRNSTQSKIQSTAVNPSKSKDDHSSSNKRIKLSEPKNDSATLSPPPTPPLVPTGDVSPDDDVDNEKSPKSPLTPLKKERYQYRDFSTAPVLDTGSHSPSKPTGSGDVLAIQKLPTKLYAILSNPAIEHIISWLPHGRSWKVHDSKLFMEEVMPHYFPYTNNYYSFIRLVNAWGFRRMSRGSSRNSYWHEMFLRGLPHLHPQMRRLTVKDKKEPLDPDEEPDLFELSSLHPLPPGEVIARETHYPQHACSKQQKQQQQQQRHNQQQHNQQDLQQQQQQQQLLLQRDRMDAEESREDANLYDAPENISPRSVLEPSSKRRNSNSSNNSNSNMAAMIHRPFAPRPLQDVSALLLRHHRQQRRRAWIAAATMNAAAVAAGYAPTTTSNEHNLYLPMTSPTTKTSSTGRCFDATTGSQENSFSRCHSFSGGSAVVPTNADSSTVLRLQQVELAATRRAMEAQLEELRSEEERLALAAAMASSTRRGSLTNQQRHHHLQQQAMISAATLQDQSRYQQHMGRTATSLSSSLRSPSAATQQQSIQPRFIQSEGSPFISHHDWM